LQLEIQHPSQETLDLPTQVEMEIHLPTEVEMEIHLPAEVEPEDETEIKEPYLNDTLILFFLLKTF
jgi:hypothetical protein